MNSSAESHSLPADVVTFRRALFLATGGGILLAGGSMMFSILSPGGFSALEWTLLTLFVPLFAQISFGFAIAFWGFVILLRGESHEVMHSLPTPAPGDPPPGSTAVVLPIFNEDPARTFAGLENMFSSLEATGDSRSFDFFVLSDSNLPDRWIEEELAWVGLCKRLNAFGRIFYRKRRISIHGKSGNIADFCRRWGGRYRYLVILDADSIIEGRTLVRLARAMDANPRAGVIQTQPRIVRGTSLLQRLVQFTTRVAGPVFAAGSNFWHLDAGNYWGHNAIIRLQPFMEHCVLPEIPGSTAANRHIMSHDTIEAALMRRAGYQVWFAYLEPGSFEEGPPNLLESLKRDRRWCQGNLQHFWFLFAPSTSFANRLHIFFGLMAYLTAPMLILFIIASAVDFHGKQHFAVLADRLAEMQAAPGATLVLLALTICLLFLPMIFGTALLIRQAAPFGGFVRLVAGGIIETLFSILLAPVLLYFYTKFVVLGLLGIRVAWKSQNRSSSAISLPDALRAFGEPTIAGVLATTAAAVWTPQLLPWLSPILLGWLLAVPLAMITSSERVGLGLARFGILRTPEETELPKILENLDGPTNAAPGSHSGLLEVALSPYANSVHVAMLRRSTVKARHKEAYLSDLRLRLLTHGPDSLSRRELLALLWDAEAIALLHREIWQCADDTLHTWWREGMRHFSTASAMRDR
ncbi:MAG: glucans biosynthesis glucosyltransferase MdoH [Terrimicrobiaceae bacterium]